MFDKAFFEEHLARHVTEKARFSETGSVTVRLRLSSGQSVAVAKLVSAHDGYVVVEIYPEKGKPRTHPRDERKQGAPQFDLDRMAINYFMISDVVVTTATPANRLGYLPSD